VEKLPTKILLSSYRQVSKTLTYGLQISFPLLFIWLICRPYPHFPGEQVMTLNDEVILRKLSTCFGLFSPSAFNVFLVIGIVLILMMENQKYVIDWQFSHIARTIAESIPLALILLAGSLFEWWLVEAHSGVRGEDIPLFTLGTSLVIKSGAAFFEELLCRLLVLAGLLWMLKTFIPYWVAAVIGITISSFFFAEIHQFSDLFILLQQSSVSDFTGYGSQAFLFRFWAGMVFGIIYLWRGFGTCVWTHAIYGFISIFIIGYV